MTYTNEVDYEVIILCNNDCDSVVSLLLKVGLQDNGEITMVYNFGYIIGMLNDKRDKTIVNIDDFKLDICYIESRSIIRKLIFEWIFFVNHRLVAYNINLKTNLCTKECIFNIIEYQSKKIIFEIDIFVIFFDKNKVPL